MTESIINCVDVSECDVVLEKQLKQKEQEYTILANKYNALKSYKKIKLKILKEKLIRCKNFGIETNHVNADKALLSYINNKEVRNIFNNIPKWYA